MGQKTIIAPGIILSGEICKMPGGKVVGVGELGWVSHYEPKKPEGEKKDLTSKTAWRRGSSLPPKIVFFRVSAFDISKLNRVFLLGCNSRNVLGSILINGTAVIKSCPASAFF